MSAERSARPAVEVGVRSLEEPEAALGGIAHSAPDLGLSAVA